MLIIGIAVGYAVGINAEKNEFILPLNTDSIPLKLKVIHDTIIKTEIIENTSPINNDNLIRIKQDSVFVDSLRIDTVRVDTLIEKLIEKPNDSIVNEEVLILTDKRLKLVNILIKHISSNSLVKDSLLKLSIDIVEVNNRYMAVEFWESPINFKGYKLSKSKLIIYGLSPQLEYQIIKNKNRYYLKFHSIVYELNETESFKSFVQIENNINDY